MTFEEAKAMQAELHAECDRLGAIYAAFPRDGLMGLPTEAVRLSPDYRAAMLASNAAFQRLRRFNAVYVKQYRRELAKERMERNSERQSRVPVTG